MTVKKEYRPMLATLVDKPFDSKEWVYETKWDGLDARGRSRFQLRQKALHDKKARLQYCVFDLLFRGRKDLRSTRLLERKRLL